MSEQKLSAEQISAIVAAGRESSPEPDRKRKPPRVRTIDFTRPTKFLQEQQRKFLRAHETGCRAAATRLTAELRTPVEIDVLAIDQMAWASVISEVPQPSMLAIVEVHPLGSRLLLTAELGAVMRMVDRLAGGSGIATAEERPLTEIEQHLSRRIFSSILEQLTPVWEELLGLRLSLLDLETKPMNVQIAPPSEPTLTLTLEKKMDQTSSTLSIVVPYRSIEPVVDRLERSFVDGMPVQSAEREVRSVLAEVPVEVRAEVGSLELTIHDVLALHEGQVLALRSSVDSGITLFADEVAIHRARPGRDGGRRAIEIVERLEPSR